MPKDEKKRDLKGWLSRSCWVAILFVVTGSAVIRGRLASMPLERDEGEYAYIAQQMLKGVPPYISAYSMKLPGIYAVYAVFLALFGQTQTGIHVGLIFFNAATIFVIFLMTRRLFGAIAGVMAGCAYAILSTTRDSLGLTANSEHFVLLPVLLGIWIITSPLKRLRLLWVFIAALFFGLAFVIKQHGVMFGGFGVFCLLYKDLRQRPVKWKMLIGDQLVFISATALPFAFICFYFWRLELFDKFWFWTFIYAREYTATVPLDAGWYLFRTTIIPIMQSSFLIWLFALAGLLMVFIRRSARVHLAFIVGFLIFSFLAVCPGLYFRRHYFIFLFPAIAIAAGAGFDWFCKLFAWFGSGIRRGLLIAAAGLICIGVSLYQQRLYLFELTPVEVCRFFYDGNPFPESLEVANYIKAYSSPDDTIAILGSEPQICFYADRRSATGFIYVYPLMETHKYSKIMQKQMIDEIILAKPEWLVFVWIHSSWIARPESTQDIFQWSDEYIMTFYKVIGVADMPPYEQTIYRWGKGAAGFEPASIQWIKVFKRKD
ncbi:MAG: glycosyltransferase family 39 protein [Sedimentisphaerales bacterium]|nr:glycosyltransferase family 39 protein [Sedimentisphaerales bacterium]